MYNLAASPTCSSSTGFVESIPVPHNTGSGGGVVKTFPIGRNYSAGVSFCLTAGGTSTDNTSAATGLYIRSTPGCARTQTTVPGKRHSIHQVKQKQKGPTPAGNLGTNDQILGSRPANSSQITVKFP